MTRTLKSALAERALRTSVDKSSLRMLVTLTKGQTLASLKIVQDT